VLEKTGDNAYKVGIKVKLGPMTMKYKGDVEIVEREDAVHHAVMRVKAKEARGQGTADATARWTSPATTATRRDDGTDVKLSGRVASMGRGDRRGRRAADDRHVLDEPAGDADGEAAARRRRRRSPHRPTARGAAPPAATAEAEAQEENVFDAGAMASDMAADRLRDPRVLADCCSSRSCSSG
jgi:hypothetical protein